MTHEKETKEMLLWLTDRRWYGLDPQRGYYLKEAATPEARESFKKWAAYQDSVGDDGYDYFMDGEIGA